MIRQPIICVMGHVDHGKCITGDALLDLGDGRILQARDVFEEFKRGQPILQPDGVVYHADGLKLLSVGENGRAVPKDASHVWKLKAHTMVRVLTKAGYEVKTTPEHKFMVLTQAAKITYVEAKQLKSGDLLLIPSGADISPLSMSKIKERILERLPDSFLIKISKELNDKIVAYCKGKAYKLGKELGDKNLYYHLQNGYYRPSTLQDLLIRMQYPKENVYDQIKAVKYSTPKQRASHKSFWLKIPHDPDEFAALYYATGLLFGDGIRATANLSNTSEVVIREFKRSIMKSFGVGTATNWRRTSYIVSHHGGKTFLKFLVAIFDFPETDKIHTLKVPELVSMSSNDLVAKFIKGFFDAEGFVETENFTGSAGVSCESAMLMQQLPSLLHRFGCLAYFVKRKNKTALELAISGSENLSAFAASIGFSEPSKAVALSKNLGKAVSSRIFDMTPLDGKFVEDLRDTYKIQGKRGFDLSYYESKSSLTRHAAQILLSLNNEVEKLPVASILSSYRTVKVTKTEVLEGDYDVYDFTVDETHNFMANGLIVHNTTLLDKIRNSSITAKEAGGITQHIGASEVPLDVINKICNGVSFGNSEVKIPGLLFIDTPGHEAFTNLRRRGSSVADLAILVVDITQGFQPQTVEAISILKEYKTPFIVAANKVDLITGWRPTGSSSIAAAMKKQDQNVLDMMEAKIYELIGSLSKYSFGGEIYNKVENFQKELAIVPISAKTGEGLAELLMLAVGLSQKFLEMKLNIETNGPGRGSVIEKKELKGMGTTVDVILYDGSLHVNDVVAFAKLDGSIASTKIKALLKPKPLHELVESASKFYNVDSVSAASGIKISAIGLEDAMPGTPIIEVTDNNFEREIGSELTDVFKTDSAGMVLKADSIGSLEAISKLLASAGARISKKGIGNVTKRDVIDAFAMNSVDAMYSVVLSFGVQIDADAEAALGASNVKHISGNIIYKLVDDYKLYVDTIKHNRMSEIAKRVTLPAEIEILPNSCFRVSHPAIFGVEVRSGTIKPGIQLINEEGEYVGKLKGVQNDGVPMESAKKGESVAVSMDEPTFGRQIRDGQKLYARLNEFDVKTLNTELSGTLSEEDKALMEKTLALERKKK